MNLLKNDFLKGFFNRGGHYVFSSSILSKVAKFILSILIVRFLSKEDFGLLTYALTIIVFISPFIGLGLNHSLLRFGSIAKGDIKKEDLHLYSLKYGLIGSLVLVLFVLIFSNLLVINKPEAQLYLVLLSFGLLTGYPYLLLLSKNRIYENNKRYSKIQIYYSIFSLSIIGFLTYKFAVIGNVIGILLVPVIIYFIFSKENYSHLYNKIKTIKFDYNKNKEHLKYALFVGFGAIASQFAIVSDHLIIGNLISNPEKLATYKVATLLPMNILFLPLVFLTTDFVHLATNYLDGLLLKKYYISYLKIFIPLTLFISLFLWMSADFVIPFLFGENYIDAIEILNILIVGLLALFLLRIPLGNILAAVGKSNWTAYNSFFMVLVNILLTIPLVKFYGIKGAAYATVIVFWVSGLINLTLFFYYLKTLKSK